MNVRLALPIAAVLALLVPGCSSSTDECTDPGTAGCMVTSGKERITSPSVPDADLAATVAGNSAFALDLYQQIRSDPGNLFYSPFSISEALAMTWAGARGKTADQMAKTLRFPLSADKLHPAFDALDLALHSRGENAKASDGGPLRLDIANAIWGQLGESFEQPFLDTLSQDYGAGMHIADFIKAPEASRQTINDWVARQTNDRIQDLMPEGTVTPDTRLVLTNAVYFNAAWAKAFDPSKTQTAGFTRGDGSSVQVPMMSGDLQASYAKGDGWSAVALPYDGHELSMVAILPDAGTLDAFEASLTPDRLDAITGGLSGYEVLVTMPRFKLTSSFSLGEKLQKMGMVDAFSDAADFTGILAKGGLQIQSVIHKAFVDVAENGTEAAAATGIGVGTTSVEEYAEIHLDHPFLFLIRDDATKTILFFGRVTDPAG